MGGQGLERPGLLHIWGEKVEPFTCEACMQIHILVFDQMPILAKRLG